jgi:hypothetical protein
MPIATHVGAHILAPTQYFGQKTRKVQNPFTTLSVDGRKILKSITNSQHSAYKCTVFWLRYLYYIRVSIPACFDPHGVIIRGRNQINKA